MDRTVRVGPEFFLFLQPASQHTGFPHLAADCEKIRLEYLVINVCMYLLSGIAIVQTFQRACQTFVMQRDPCP